MAAVLLGFAATPAAAAAEDFTAHFQQAQTCYENKDFDCAVRELQAAYQIKPVPALLLNIGHAHLDAGRPQEALTFYGMYLQSEKKLTSGVRAEVEKFRAQARERLKNAPPTPPTPPPTPATDPLQTGNQTPNQVTSPPSVPTVTPEPPTPTVTPEPPTVTAPVPPPQPSTAVHSSRPPGGALALLGVGAGLLIVGIGLGGGAVATAGQVTSGSGPFDADLDSRGRTLSYAGAAFDVLGAVALVSGIGWTISWATHRNKEKAPAPTAVSVRPGGAGALVLGRF